VICGTLPPGATPELTTRRQLALIVRDFFGDVVVKSTEGWRLATFSRHDFDDERATAVILMNTRQKYVKRATQFVIAVQLDLETDGFTYQKWDHPQRCKRGDWLVNNNGDTYTVDRETFARTYKATGPGTYVKTAPVWAEVATAPGAVPTKEGATRYEAGDYLVSNEQDGSDAYAVSKREFERMYEPAT
jgi:hypothetical protein